jgi:tol-pal system protein YbgF
MRRLLLLALLTLAPGPAAAADPATLRAQIGELRAELGQIRLAQAQDPNLRTAALEVRLSRLEELIRQLTGRIEEVEYAQRQTAARIDKLVADLDARLPGVAAARDAAPPPAQAAAPAQAPTTPTRQAPPSIIAPDDAARQGYVLGTIPQGALQGQTASPPATAPAPTTQARLAPQGADGVYRQALDQLQAGSWAAAEQSFENFVSSYPEDPRASTASYWIGETYLFRKDYPTAASVFARNYREYGEEAPRAADNLLKLGMSLAAMGDRDRACQTFAELAKRHPNASAPIRQALNREKTAADCS